MSPDSTRRAVEQKKRRFDTDMEKQRILTVCVIATLSLTSMAFTQTAGKDSSVYGWKKDVTGNLNLTQASFDNWGQGGENTLAWQVNLTAAFTLEQEKYTWASTGKFTLGFAKIEGNEARKSADEIKLESVYTRKLSTYLSPFISVTAQTQFTSGFQYADKDTKTKISSFLDPGYFTQNIGMEYKRGDLLNTRLGATVKETITSDFPVPFADDPETAKLEKTKVEPGISSITELKAALHENIVWKSRLDIFSDLEAFDRIDLLWENDVIMKVTKYINVNFEFDVLYDKDISDRRQIKQVLSLGLTYSFL